MMTWNKMYYNFPSSYLMESLLMISDYIQMFLLSILMMISFVIFMIFNDKSFFFSEYLENNELEFNWTVVPSILLIFLALPSLKTLYMMDSCIFCGVNLKVMGNQWYWTYSYNDLNFNEMNCYMLIDSSMRLIETDNSLLVPIKVPIRLMISSTDVIHSWTIPSLGVKMDAVPGRINQCCFMLNKMGKLFGQCSEICGSNHSFMPISIEVIPMDKFFSIMGK